METITEPNKYIYFGGWSIKFFESVGFSVGVRDYDKLSYGLGDIISITILFVTIEFSNFMLFYSPEAKIEFEEQLKNLK